MLQLQIDTISQEYADNNFKNQFYATFVGKVQIYCVAHKHLIISVNFEITVDFSELFDFGVWSTPR